MRIKQEACRITYANLSSLGEGKDKNVLKAIPETIVYRHSTSVFYPLSETLKWKRNHDFRDNLPSSKLAHPLPLRLIKPAALIWQGIKAALALGTCCQLYYLFLTNPHQAAVHRCQQPRRPQQHYARGSKTYWPICDRWTARETGV